MIDLSKRWFGKRWHWMTISMILGWLAAMPLAHAANALNGQTLYNNNCFVCHGPGGPNGARANRTAAQIATAINTQLAMAQFVGKFSAADLDDIAAYLAVPITPPAAPIAVISPSTLTFGATVVGQGSASLDATLSNTGNATLSLVSIGLSGAAAGDFSISGGTCASGGELAPNASCSVSIGFKPTVVGTRTAALNLSHNASGNISTVDLNGSGSALPQAAISVSPSSLDFGEVPINMTSPSRTLIVSNSGSGALNFSSIVLAGSNAAQFSLAGSCSVQVPVAAGGSCTLSVEMLPGRLGPVAAILNLISNAGSVAVGLSGTGAAVPVAAVASYQGLWWNPNESGWGMSVTQHNNMIFAAFYTYDQNGQPVWYVMSSCPLSGASCNGEIYKVSGGTSPAVAWNGTAKAVASVGTGTLSFTDADNGSLSFILNGVSGSKTISRQVFASGSTLPALDYTDLWWNPNESGWGLALTQQYAMIFATWYTYDAAGKPIWYVASSCPVVSTGCSGDVYQINGGSQLSAVWNGANKAVIKVGSVSFAFIDGGNGVMTYSINGVAGSRVIARQPF